MAKDPGLGYKVVATVTGIKGKCNVDHRVGESFEISIHNAGVFVAHSTTIFFPAYRPSSSAEVCPGGRETLYSSNAQIATTL